MSRICLDTSAYSLFRLGHPEAFRIVKSSRDLGIPAIVLGELRSGFRLGKLPRENESSLQEFLAEPNVEVYDVDDDASRHYAELFAELRRAGTPVPPNDLWIAATALREGATVLTFDSDFRRIPRVGVLVLKP